MLQSYCDFVNLVLEYGQISCQTTKFIIVVAQSVYDSATTLATSEIIFQILPIVILSCYHNVLSFLSHSLSHPANPHCLNFPLHICRVHTDKTLLQEQLSELQLQQQQELEALQNRLNQSVNISGPPGVPPATDQTGPLGVIQSHHRQLLAAGGGESRQLMEHEAALQRLEELQQTMIGGERAGDRELKEELAERRRKAEDKRELLLRASRTADDDDGIIEGIFNSLTGMCIFLPV